MQTDTLAQPASIFPELDDPQFIKRFDAAVAVEQAEFDAWLAQDKFEELIAGAKAEGAKAYKDAAALPDGDGNLTTWIEIDFKHRRAEPLIQSLDNAGVGFAEIQSWSWFINSGHVLPKRRRGYYGTARQNHAAVEAFAMALTRPGFELKITRE